jgi:hypothetical protein
MNSKPICRPKILNDESHAKAIVFNWIDHAISKQETNIEHIKSQGWVCQKGKKYNYNKILAPRLEAMKPTIIFRSDEFERHLLRGGKVPSVVSILYFSNRQRIFHPDVNCDFKYVGLILDHIDTKNMKQTGLLACLLSDHFLARVLMRTESNNLSSLFVHIQDLFNHIFNGIMTNKIPKENFLIVTRHALFPMEYFEVESKPTLRTKTFIPSNEWVGVTKKVCEDIVSQFSSNLESCIILSDEFEKRKLKYT